MYNFSHSLSPSVTTSTTYPHVHLLLFYAHLHVENLFYNFVLTTICCSPLLLNFFSIGAPLQIHQILLFVYLCLFPFFHIISHSSYFIYSLFGELNLFFVSTKKIYRSLLIQIFLCFFNSHILSSDFVVLDSDFLLWFL